MFFNHTTSIGLDISDFCIKSVKLSGKPGNVRLVKAKSIGVPPGAIAQGRILKNDIVVKLIQKILENTMGHSNKRFVHAVLPDTATFIKLIEIDEDDNSEGTLEERIQKEAAHHIPYNLEDVYIDSQRIESFTSRNTQQVLLGVCPKEVVDEYINIINQAGYIPKTLEVESVPITRSVFRIQKGKSLSSKNIIVIDFGAARSSLIFWREQKYFNLDTIEFSVSVPLSSYRINKRIESELNLNLNQAEEFKKRCGLSKGEKCKGVLLRILEPMLEDLINRLEQSIEFHNTHFKGAKTDKILLCGGSANLKELDLYIQEKLGIETSLANPLSNISHNKIMSQNESLSYTTAIGLALREFCT